MRLIIWAISIILVSCGQVVNPLEQPLEDNGSFESFYSPEVEDSFLQFTIDAADYDVMVPDGVRFKLGDVDGTVGCDGTDIVFSKSKWNQLNDPTYKESKYEYYRSQVRTMTYKGGALCLLGQDSRQNLNHLPHIVPVPSSITFKHNVSVFWVTNQCYEENSLSTYATIDECEYYQRESFWSAYVHELFTGDDSLVLEKANEASIQALDPIDWDRLYIQIIIMINNKKLNEGEDYTVEVQ